MVLARYKNDMYLFKKYLKYRLFISIQVYLYHIDYEIDKIYSNIYQAI